MSKIILSDKQIPVVKETIVITENAIWGSIQGNIANQTDLQQALDQKVDADAGKGLSANDFTDEYKEKLDDLENVNLIAGDNVEITGQYPDLTVTANVPTDGIPTSEKGQPNGVATLDSDGKVPGEQLPDIASPVTSVNSKTGAVVLTAADVGAATVANINTRLLSNPVSNPISYNQGGTANTNILAIGNAAMIVSGGSNAQSVALGSAAVGSSNSVTIGHNARSGNYAEVGFPPLPQLTIRYSCVVIGNNAQANGDSAVVIGSGASASAQGTSIGQGASATLNASVAVGKTASSGNYAVSLGSDAQASGTDSVSLGCQAGYGVTNSYTNRVCLGRSTTVTGSNQIQLGNSSTTTYAYGAVQDRSDARDKADIQICDLGLDFINALQPKKYKWDYREDYVAELFLILNRDDFETEEDYQSAVDQQQQDRCAFFANPVKDGSKTRSRYHYGLIADELKDTLDTLNIDFGGYQDHSVSGGMCVKSIGYMELIAPLIKAIQELSAEVQALKNQAN